MYNMLIKGMDTVDALKFLAEGSRCFFFFWTNKVFCLCNVLCVVKSDSGNVDNAGNFSIQVLQTAMYNYNNMSLIPWAMNQLMDPSDQMGFIVNRQVAY